MPAGVRDYNSLLGAQDSYEYDVYFYSDVISTVVTIDPSTVTQWISDVQFSHGVGTQPLIVGLDTEWSLFATAASRNPVATIQLCVGRRCPIYQISHSPYVPNSLADFLSGDAIFVGVGVKQDLQKLRDEYGIGGAATKMVELGRMAAEVYGRKELKNSGLKSLASLVLKKEMEKKKEVTMSRWDNRWLAAEQVRYACLDAFVSSEIARILFQHFSDVTL